MHHYSQGEPTRQGHKGIAEGYYEEEQGLLGFFGPVSHLIKKKPSTRWVEIEGPLRPHMYDLVELPKSPQWQRLLYNRSVSIYKSCCEPSSNATLRAARDADGDLLYFCHKGSGRILTEYGLLTYSPGQYIVMPKCLTHCFVPEEKTEFLIIENHGSHYQEPDRGIVGRHAPYDINALGKPDLQAQQEFLSKQGLEILEVEVKHSGRPTLFRYRECIMDTVGWKGDLFPYTLHMDHIMPLMSHRVHLPPSAHTTFVARDFVVCSFLPRPLEQDEDALKVPFYHQNIDYDEVLFYHDGDFFSRDNLHAGMMSFHPAGFPHGPHPKAVKNIGGKTHTNEYAVMIDTRWPLSVDPQLESVELADYWKSWQE